MDRETFQASVNLVTICCNQIKTHLKESHKDNYDWRHEIRECVSEIETELESWKKVK